MTKNSLSGFERYCRPPHLPAAHPRPTMLRTIPGTNKAALHRIRISTGQCELDPP
jgi:hypothetical protein